MDPAKSTHIEPADPFFHERADHAILDKIEIPAEADDCDKSLRRLRPILMKVSGVREVAADKENDRIVVTFDARKTHAPDLHDAILESSQKNVLADE